MSWSSSCRVASILLTAILFVPAGCLVPQEVYGPPCFDGSYDVEFLDRLAESDCPVGLADGWTFHVDPQSYGAPGECSETALELTTILPRTIAPGVTPTVNGFDPPMRAAGSISETHRVEDPSCQMTTMLVAFIPDETTAVADAIEQDAVVWGATTSHIASTCGIDVPSGGHCTDFYRARMTKTADWNPE